MIIESIQRVYSVSPLYTEQTVYTTSIDPKTHKEYQEIVVYKVYNSLGQVEENHRQQVDVRA
jgi:hypothetical protein